MQEVFILNIGGKSNNDSISCGLQNADPVPFENILERIKGANNKNILIIGGEPTIHPDFIKVLKILNNRNVSVLTNGRMLSYDAFCDSIKNKNMHFLVEVFSHDGKKHDKLTKVRGSFKQTINGIKKPIERNFNVSVVIPLINGSIKDIEETIDFFKGFDLGNIILYNPAPNNSIDSSKIPKFITKKTGIGKILSENPFLVRIENIPYCFLKQKGSISHFLPYNDRFKIRVAQCKECDYQNICPGIFKEYLNAHGSKEVKRIKELNAKIIDVQRSVMQKSPLYVSEDEIIQLLRSLNKNKDFWDMVYETGYPIPIAIIILDELKKRGIVSINGITIKKKIEFPANSNAVSDFSNARLIANPKLCQLTVANESIKRRVEYISTVCLTKGNMAILGDDDFISLSLASKNVFDKIVVFEIDKKVANKIRMIAKKNRFNVEVIDCDLRKRMPKRYHHKFDAFYTDCPYTLNGFALFISRGIDLLKKKPKAHGFASLSCEMPVLDGVELPIQEVITKMNLFIQKKSVPGLNNIPTYLKRKFNGFEKLNRAIFSENKNLSKIDRWYLATLGRKESLFHFLTTEHTMPYIKDECNDEIYYKEEPIKLYLSGTKKGAGL